MFILENALNGTLTSTNGANPFGNINERDDESYHNLSTIPSQMISHYNYRLGSAAANYPHIDDR